MELYVCNIYRVVNIANKTKNYWNVSNKIWKLHYDNKLQNLLKITLRQHKKQHEMYAG